MNPAAQTASSAPFFLDAERLQELARDRAEAYRGATPFPHTVLDDFLPPSVIDACIAEFPAPGDIAWGVLKDSGNSNKLASSDETLMGPVTRQVIAQLNSGTMIKFLEALTGISGLVPDPHLVGGGMHQLADGGFLKVHADFNIHPHLNLDRRINVLLYLNPDWKEEYGGNLELWKQDASECERRIVPIANRCVIFNTTDTAFHGNPQPVAAPSGMTRRSLAFYYYTQGRPAEEQSETHTTLYRGPGAKPLRPPLSYRLRAAGLRFVPPIFLDLARTLKRRRSS